MRIAFCVFPAVLVAASLLGGCSSGGAQVTANHPASTPESEQSVAETTKLFGVPIRGHSRTALLDSLKQQGRTATQTDKDQFEVRADGVLDEAKTLTLQFDGDEFVVARYVFPSDMDPAQVSRIENLVAAKYGKPDSIDGNPAIGDVTIRWKRPDGARIVVMRGWPDTTTQLVYGDPEAARRFQAAQDSAKQHDQADAAKRQGQSF